MKSVNRLFRKSRKKSDNQEQDSFSHSKYECNNKGNKSSEHVRKLEQKSPGGARKDALLRGYGIYKHTGSEPLRDRNGRIIG
mmetsp:Transcript_7309/g.8388  ORF Transcript_7309/g.8388 Transcript_7309/m.8388 type:complete len:82 (-) Transcript_7309:1386-1631(-)